MLDKANEKVIAAVDEHVREESDYYLEETLPKGMRTPCHALSFMVDEKIGFFRAGGTSLVAMIKDHIQGLGFGTLLSARHEVSKWLEMSKDEAAARGNEWFEETYLDLVAKRLRTLARESVTAEGWDVSYIAEKGTLDCKEPSASVTIWMDGEVCATYRCRTGYRPAWALYCTILDSIVDTGRAPQAFVGDKMCSGAEVEKAMEAWCWRAYPSLAAAEAFTVSANSDSGLLADALSSMSEMLRDEWLSEQAKKLTASMAVSALDEKLNAA